MSRRSTPGLQNIDGNNKTLVSVAALGVGIASPTYMLDVYPPGGANVNCFRVRIGDQGSSFSCFTDASAYDNVTCATRFFTVTGYGNTPIFADTFYPRVSVGHQNPVTTLHIVGPGNQTQGQLKIQSGDHVAGLSLYTAGATAHPLALNWMIATNFSAYGDYVLDFPRRHDSYVSWWLQGAQCGRKRLCKSSLMKEET
jgi:hypothetical protein